MTMLAQIALGFALGMVWHVYAQRQGRRSGGYVENGSDVDVMSARVLDYSGQWRRGPASARPKRPKHNPRPPQGGSGVKRAPLTVVLVNCRSGHHPRMFAARGEGITLPSCCELAIVGKG